MGLRPAVQTAFVALTVAGVFVVGGHAERWCPFGGVEALCSLAAGGGFPCSLAATNLFLLGGVILGAVLVRRAFCGYACPIGAVSEWIRRAAARIGVPAIPVTEGLHRALSLLKYVVLAAILLFTVRAGELVFRGYDPCYALISRHGEDITVFAYLVAGAVAASSIALSMPFCRWLCPLAAALNPFSRVSPARIVRDERSCSGCGKCARACAMGIPVDRVVEVTHARCTACLDCVDACASRSEGAIGMRLSPWGGRRASRGMVAGLVVLLLAAGVVAATLLPIPAWSFGRGELPPRAATIVLEVDGLTCRGRAQLLTFFLTRDDDLSLGGPLELDAWPAPDAGRARVTFDPEETDADAVRSALTAPLFDPSTGRWRTPPFAIRGYDPLGLGR